MQEESDNHIIIILPNSCTKLLVYVLNKLEPGIYPKDNHVTYHTIEAHKNLFYDIKAGALLGMALN